ncbi:MAG: iron ABC transporter permease [Oscillospiraceae bacterium]|nr:iron ABC transporter permease [Oscillospiraceae bacterium]MDD4413369.1 iron ABC transporter permease [Oscillospiraceae bacterium]
MGSKQNGRLPISIIAIIGGLSLIITIVLSVQVGSTRISIPDIIRSILAAIGVIPVDSVDPSIYMVINGVRLPRVLCGVLAGGGLAVSGTIMQGVFRNPLADPGLLGVSAGASFGALISMSFGMAASFILYLPTMAFIGALLAVLIIIGISFATHGGRVSSVSLIMSGMAVSALFSALTSLLLTLVNEYQVNNYIFWTMGGLTNRRWEHVMTMLVPVIGCTIALFLLAGRLDVMLLGDEQAHALGVRSSRNRILMIVLASLCTASIVSVTGPIGFVGLIIPHIFRMIVGPSHRRLCVASFFGGGMFLTICDTLVRFISGFNGRELSVGIITALIGSPYFIFLLIKRRGKTFTA